MLEHALGLTMRFSHQFDNSIHLLMKSVNNFSSEFKGHDIVKTDKKKARIIQNHKNNYKLHY